MDRSVTRPNYGLRREKSKEVGIAGSWQMWGTGIPLYRLCSKAWTEDTMRQGYLLCAGALLKFLPQRPYSTLTHVGYQDLNYSGS